MSRYGRSLKYFKKLGQVAYIKRAIANGQTIRVPVICQFCVATVAVLMG